MIIEACCMGTFNWVTKISHKIWKMNINTSLLLLFEQFTAQVASKSEKCINTATTLMSRWKCSSSIFFHKLLGKCARDLFTFGFVSFKFAREFCQG